MKGDKYHDFSGVSGHCVACCKSLYEIVENDLPCSANRMFCAVLELRA